MPLLKFSSNENQTEFSVLVGQKAEGQSVGTTKTEMGSLLVVTPPEEKTSIILLTLGLLLRRLPSYNKNKTCTDCSGSSWFHNRSKRRPLTLSYFVFGRFASLTSVFLIPLAARRCLCHVSSSCHSSINVW